MLFSTFLSRPLHDYDVKPPNLPFYGGSGHATMEFSFLFLNLNKILKNSTPGKVACIWHIERVQIDAIKFARTLIHFFCRPFHCCRRRPCLRSLLYPGSSMFNPWRTFCCQVVIVSIALIWFTSNPALWASALCGHLIMTNSFRCRCGKPPHYFLKSTLSIRTSR